MDEDTNRSCNDCFVFKGKWCSIIKTGREDGKNFINQQGVWPDEELEIIDVRPVGKAYYPKSICYKSVEVLT